MKIGIYPLVGDILHIGHILAIEEAKKHCDYLVVALHCCPNYKKPIQTIYERYMQLKALKYIDDVLPYENGDDLKQIILSFNFDVYFLGEDYRNKKWDCYDELEKMNKEIYFINRKHRYSSSYFKDKIKGAK